MRPGSRFLASRMMTMSGMLTATRRGERTWRFGRSPVALLLLAPAVGLLTVVILIPSVQLLWLSFTDYSPGIGGEFVGFKNYVLVITDPAFQAALLRNILYVVVVVAGELLIGLGIALFLQLELPLRPLWLALVIAPYAVSPIVAVVMWKYMLDPNFGVVNYMLTSVGLPAIQWLSSAATSMAAIILVAIWKEFSFTTIVLFAALTTVPKELYEASKIDGANAVQRLWHVTLPLITPAIAIVLLFRVIFTLREFGIPQTFTGGGPGTATEILSLYLYKEAFRYSSFGTGSATGWLMLIVTLILSSLLIRRTYRGMFGGAGR
jgi:multiple sugar transport system permease protein